MSRFKLYNHDQNLIVSI